MIRPRTLTVLSAVLAGLFLLAADASAQAPRYQPSRPTLSPYLNLFRNQRGPVPNYHLYVRPILQQQSINAQQGAAVQQLEQGLRETQTTQSGPTGIGSGYRNFSHYYSGLR
ncbi:MAG: hypothetical protein WD875_17710 [Pirellulales bacterium]